MRGDKIRENYKLFSEQILTVRKGAFLMRKTTERKAKEHNLTDKHNDNVICYVFREVILCR